MGYLMIKKKHVLFDFDGTLINTNEIIIDSWQAVFKHYLGQPGDRDRIYASFGEPLKETMMEFFPGVDQDEAISIYRKYQKENFEDKIDLFPGMIDLIKDLRETGRTTSIVTSRLRTTTLQYLDRFGIADLFDVIVTCDDTDKHKPDPEPVLTALKKLGATPDEAIFLGDTRFDIGCANNAGVESVLVTWSHPLPVEEMEREGFLPTYVMDFPNQLYDFI